MEIRRFGPMSADCGPVSVENENKPFGLNSVSLLWTELFQAVKTVRLSSASATNRFWFRLSADTEKGSNLSWENPPHFSGAIT